MTELFAYLFGALIGFSAIAVTIAHLYYQARRLFKAPAAIRVLGALIWLSSIAAVAPPHAYSDLDRMMIGALLTIALCVIALFSNRSYWKLVALGHGGVAALWFFACVQAAR